MARWNSWMAPYRVAMSPLASEESLVAGMASSDPGVRAWTAVNPRANEAVWVLAARDPDVFVRRGLAEHLAQRARMHRPVPVQVLEYLRNDEDERVSELAQRALYWVR